METKRPNPDTISEEKLKEFEDRIVDKDVLGTLKLIIDRMTKIIMSRKDIGSDFNLSSHSLTGSKAAFDLQLFRLKKRKFIGTFSDLKMDHPKIYDNITGIMIVDKIDNWVE